MSRFPSAAPARVDVRAIDREIQRLWREVNERPEAVLGEGASAPVTRICTLTLVAVASDDATAQMISDVTAGLVGQHPCRSIVLRFLEGDSDRLDAAIALVCGRALAGRPPVCCEQITIEAAGRALARLPGLVFPLLVPDLPVYVWWAGQVPREGEPRREVLRRLLDVADALVVDSAGMPDPMGALGSVASLSRSLPRGLRDLTWGRLTPWRDLLAQTFDPAPLAAALDRVDRVRITAGGSPSTDPVGALLLLGWLGSRLGWEVERPASRKDGRMDGELRRSGGVVQAEVVGGPGPVSSVELQAGGQERVVVVITRRSEEEVASVEVRVGRGRPRSHTAGFVSFDQVALLAREIDLATPDTAFLDALELAQRFLPEG